MRHTLLSILGSALLLSGCEHDSPPPTSSVTPPVVAEPAAVRPSAVAAASLLAAAPPPAAPVGAVAAGAASAHFGAPLSTAVAVPAKTLLADPAKFDDKEVKLTGQVSAACQMKGCWMTVGTGEPGQQTVRVSFKDYGFFVPKDCMGKTAVVEGHFKVTTLSVAQAQHFADDAAKAGTVAQKITAPQHTLALVATGVDLL